METESDLRLIISNNMWRDCHPAHKIFSCYSLISFYVQSSPPINHRPPRRASTRCRTDPAAILKSFAVLSSGLGVRFSIKSNHTYITLTFACLRRSTVAVVEEHRTAPLLSPWFGWSIGIMTTSRSAQRIIGHNTHFIIEINVKLDLAESWCEFRTKI